MLHACEIGRVRDTHIGQVGQHQLHQKDICDLNTMHHQGQPSRHEFRVPGRRDITYTASSTACMNSASDSCTPCLKKPVKSPVSRPRHSESVGGSRASQYIDAYHTCRELDIPNRMYIAGMVSPEPRAAIHDAATTSLSRGFAYVNILCASRY